MNARIRLPLRRPADPEQAGPPPCPRPDHCHRCALDALRTAHAALGETLCAVCFVHTRPNDQCPGCRAETAAVRALDAIARVLVNKRTPPHPGVPVSYPHFSTDCAEHHDLVRDFGSDGPRPRIVVLCRSTRFYDAFQEANYRLTMQGAIVLSVGFYPHSKAIHGHGEGVGHDSTEKVALDQLHLRKIDLADEVLVLNVGDYIGESTRREIEYAQRIGRPVGYLEPRQIGALAVNL